MRHLADQNILYHNPLPKISAAIRSHFLSSSSFAAPRSKHFRDMKIAAVLALATGLSVSLVGCSGGSCAHDVCTPEGLAAMAADALKTDITDEASVCAAAKDTYACSQKQAECEGVTEAQKTVYAAVTEPEC